MPELTYDDWIAGADTAVMGRAPMEPLSPTNRVWRTAAVLEVCRREWPRIPEVDHVVDIAKDMTRWGEAHQAFDAVRRLTLLEQEARTNETYCALLFVAEIAAETAYNAAGPADPFDADSAWWIVPNARAFALCIEDRQVRQRIWRALLDEPSGGAG